MGSRLCISALCTLAFGGGALALVGIGGPLVLPVSALFAAFLVTGAHLDVNLALFGPVISHSPQYEPLGAVSVTSGTVAALALTFDDGPHPETTQAVLDRLAEYDQIATFFLIGRKTATHPEVVREIVRRGHAVGIHGYTHDRLFSLRSYTRVKGELTRAKAELEAIAGTPVTLFRPPIGHTSPAIARAAHELGLQLVGWSCRAGDGVSWAKPHRVLKRAIGGLRAGAIVMLHDASEGDTRRPVCLDILPQVLDEMKRRGFRSRPLR